MDRILRNILIRQIPILLCSIVTGAILIFYVGFWLGAIVNAVAWGTAVFMAKIYVRKIKNNSDPFHDDRYLMYFVLGLLGRNK